MKIFSSLKNIDLVDLNYYVSYLRNSSESSSKARALNNVYLVFLFILKQIIKDFICIVKNRSLLNKDLLFYSSVNQYNSLFPVYEEFENSIFVTIMHKRKDSQLPMAMGCFVSILLAPRFFRLLNRRNKKEKDFVLNNCVDYFFIEGMYIWWTFYLKIKKPKRIFFSNDHLVWHRVLRKAAQSNSIPTVYLQHASVTENFPKLEFDISLLEGEDALNKYCKKGVFGQVELIGMVKFDRYFSRINRNEKIQSIGICTKILDDEIHIEMLCSLISSSFNGLDLFLRPHPRDSRYSFYQKMKDKFQLQLSDSTRENSFEYLQKVDVNIAGETSIHIEAVLMNVYPVYFNLNDKIIDHYGYLENRLVTDVFNNISDLAIFLNEIKNNKKNIRARAKYYIDTVNSEFDGASSKLLKSYVI